ncbi:MAG TPA: rhodanese-like domain-containing protein [Actinobacteria bacterium]|nr:rhodanese-like domain-containing protein [Actinomycetota bacterium]
MTTSTTTVEQVPATRWQEWLAETGGVLLDVREPLEWAQGTLPGSTLLQMSGMPGNLGELDPTRPVLVVCRSGNRSQIVARYLAEQGFRAANLVGGLVALGLA